MRPKMRKALLRLKRRDHFYMLAELETSNKVVGAKQVRRALNDGRARKVFLALDADPRVTEPLAQLSGEKGIAVVEIPSMRELGNACGISVGAAVAALV